MYTYINDIYIFIYRHIFKYIHARIVYNYFFFYIEV